MHVEELLAGLGSGDPPPVVLVVGAERLFADRAVTALRAAALADGVEGFNEDTFQGKGGSAARVVDAARTLPMMAARRFVLVRSAEAMAPAELDRLAEYIAAPSPSTCVVILADKLDGRSKLVARAKKAGALVEASPLKQREMPAFVAAEARRRDLTLARDAAAALIDAVGTDLSAVDDALERLSLYAGGSGKIALADVEACVTKVRVETIWALVDAVGLRDRRKALIATSSLLSDREPPLRILSMVARQLRMIGRVQDCLARGQSPQDAAREAGAPPFKAGELATAARRFGPRDLAAAFAILAETDLALKGSRRPPDTILESAILQLTRT